MQMQSRWVLLSLSGLLLALPLTLSGCDALGYVVSTAAGTETIAASYKGLANQKCAVMVWADQGVVDDYGSIQLDIARGLETKLLEADKAKIPEVANITWIAPERIIQYQQNHPETSAEAVEDVASRLPVSRLIYIEVDQFQTHPIDSPDLSRGSITATVEVVEVNQGHSKVAYTERDVNVVSPKDCPPEGLPDLDDGAVYEGTLEAFTSAVGARFVPHEQDVDLDTPTTDTPDARFQE
jgi:hypothetical protein